MKKAMTMLLAMAVMLACLPLGMVSYAAEAAYNRPTYDGMQWLDPSGLTKFGNGISQFPAASAFDGLLGEVNGGDRNFFENTGKAGGYVGVDLGADQVQFVRKIRYLPRYTFADRLNDAVFEGSNLSQTEGFVPLAAPLSGHGYANDDETQSKDLAGKNGWFELDLAPHFNAYRYLRLRRATEVALNVAEIEFYVATGADYIASRAAYVIGKDVRTWGNAAQAVVELPALSDAEKASYTVAYQVMEGAAVLDNTAGTITYTPSAAEDLPAKIKVTATSRNDPTDTRTFEVPVTVKRQAKGMSKVNADMYQDTFSSSEVGKGLKRWVVDGNLGRVNGEDDNFFESAKNTDEYVGIELKGGNENKFVRKIRFLPRFGFAHRLNGAVFEGSNTANNATDYTPLAAPLSGHVQDETDNNIYGGLNGWFEIDLFDNVDAYKYIRLMRSLLVIQADNNPLNVTEIELYMAEGADHIASLVASRIGKVIPRPQDGTGKTEKTLTDLTADTDGYTVTFAAAEGSQGVSIDQDNKITFTHSDAADVNAVINVTAAGGGDARTIPLPVVIKQNIDEAGMLAADKAMVDEAFRAAAGAAEVGSSPVVNGYIDLPTETRYGSTVEWAVSGANADAVTIENHKLSSTDQDAETKTVTLTATVTLNGTQTDTLTYTNVTVNSGLQIWYKFDADSVDESAKTVQNSGFNTDIGTATLMKGAAALQDVGSTGAVFLSNTGRKADTDHVKMPPNIVANITGDYTISVMMYKDGDDGWPFYISNSGQGSNNAWFGVLPGGNYMFDSKGSNGDRDHQINPAGNYRDQWTNIVLSYSGQTMTMYVNGENKGSKEIPFKLSEKFGDQPGDAWNLLGATGWGDAGYTGLISDFRIYSRTLSAEEAKTISDGKPTANYADWKAVGQCKSGLNIEKTENVVANIALPTAPENNGSTVTWKSSDPSVVTDAGVIKANADGTEEATLTATITKGTASASKKFQIKLAAGAGDPDTLVRKALEWLNGTAEVHYDFAANTVDGQDFVLMTLPAKAPNESRIAWTYNDKGVGAEGSALTDNNDGTVRLLVWKSAFEALSGTLKATITNGAATDSNFTKPVTAEKLNEVVIVTNAEAVSGTAQFNDTYGLLTTKTGKMYFKFDVSDVNQKIAAANKKIVKAELQVRNSLSRAPRPVIVKEVANSEWAHGARLGPEIVDGVPVPDSEKTAIPADVELAFVGDSVPVYSVGRYDITYAFLNGLSSEAFSYTLSLTNNSNNPVDWPNNNSAANSINKANEPQNWTRLVLTLADSQAAAPEAYAEITKDAYNIEAIYGDKRLAAGVPIQLPTPSITIPNPDYVAPAADDPKEGETPPEIPETVELKGVWHVSNATIDSENRMTITNEDEDVIIGLYLDGYTRCFTLSHENIVGYQYLKEDVAGGGIKLTKAENAGEGFAYIVVYDAKGILLSVDCQSLKDGVAWSDDGTCTFNPTVTDGQRAKCFVWDDNLVPYF